MRLFYFNLQAKGAVTHSSPLTTSSKLVSSSPSVALPSTLPRNFKQSRAPPFPAPPYHPTPSEHPLSTPPFPAPPYHPSHSEHPLSTPPLPAPTYHPSTHSEHHKSSSYVRHQNGLALKRKESLAHEKSLVGVPGSYSIKVGESEYSAQGSESVQQAYLSQLLLQILEAPNLSFSTRKRQLTKV